MTSAAGALGWSLAGVRWCLQTHEHADPLDPVALMLRSAAEGVPDPATIELVAAEGTLAGVAALVAAGLTRCLCPIAAGERVAIGPYRVTAVPTSHGAAEPLLFAIAPGRAGEGRAFFSATDTGPLADEAWRILARWGGRFRQGASRPRPRPRPRDG